MLPTGQQIQTERQARKYLDEQKQEAATVTDDDQADGGADINRGDPLAGMEPDPVGVSDRPPDRVTFLLDGLGTLWREYQQMFHSEAEWLPWRVAVEQFSVLMDKD